jgi:hypothetical protein
MRALQITLFIIGFIVLSTQSFRHIYVKWIEPTSSVLDKYNEKVENDIESSKNLNELEAIYAQAHAKVEKYEADSSNIQIESEEKWDKEPYKSEFKAKQAIEQWESRHRMLFELYFYWFCGLASIILGVLSYRYVNAWIGISGVITGFSEMACWTSPLFRSFGEHGAFDMLLNAKLALSVTSFGLLVLLWLVSNKFLVDKTKPGGHP